MVKLLGLVTGMTLIALVLYLIQFQRNNPKKVLEYGRVMSGSPESPRKGIEVRTRRVRQASLDYWEVEVSQDVWRDCALDCAAAYRAAKAGL